MDFTRCRQREWMRFVSMVYWYVQTIFGRDYGRAGLLQIVVRKRIRLKTINIMIVKIIQLLPVIKKISEVVLKLDLKQ
jgi:hypothetical protein